MSARLYDYIITVADASNFRNGNTVLGESSGTFGRIANVNTENNTIKVKLSNLYQEFTVGESLTSNHYLLAGSFNSIVLTAPAYANIATQYDITTLNAPSTNSISVFTRYNSTTWKSIFSGKDWTSVLNNFLRFLDSYPKPGEEILVISETGFLNSNNFYHSANTFGDSIQSASSAITSIAPSPFIATLNSFTQAPIVRLIDVYYPGEWHPSNEYGNPSGSGEGYAWPTNMPVRLAEVVGDVFSDLQYNVTYAGASYIPYPIESSGIGTSSDGTIDRFTLMISNYDNLITTIVENPYLVGNVTSNAATGYVNGQLVNGLDPRTVIGNEHYDQTVVDDIYGKANSSWLYSESIKYGETWKNLKADSRDLLGAVVEIKTTFANHLRYWPEHSRIDYITSNIVSVVNSGPYRPGDNVTTQYSTNTVRISDIQEDRLLHLSTELSNASVGENLYIVNDEYDEEAYVSDTFKITKLSKLDEKIAEFELTSWLQYFKLQLPKRKYYKNTCQWIYKGSECQYPGPGGLAIPGTSLYSNSYPITQSNEQGVLAEDDECSKSFQACKVRNNTVHFGAFPGTGRQVPRQ